MLHAVPLSGSVGLVVSLMTASHAATLVMPEVGLPLELLRLLESERITTGYMFDTTAMKILDHPDLERYDRSALRTETLRIGHTMAAPAEIETFLMGHPSVAQAFVVGVPDASLGEVAVAYVIPRSGQSVTEKELQDHCRGRLTSVKAPRHVFVVADVPRSRGPHGAKAQRTQLRQLALRTLGLDP